jgi:hypothetical protein
MSWPSPESPQTFPAVTRKDDDSTILSVYGRLNYLAPSVASSLYKNGLVRSNRNVEGSDDALIGANFEKIDVKIENGRLSQSPICLNQDGFELYVDPITFIDFDNNDEIVNIYYKACEQLLKKVTGASVVAAFDHNVRSRKRKESGEKIGSGNAVQGPAFLVHADYTLDSGPQRVNDMTSPPKVCFLLQN